MQETMRLAILPISLHPSTMLRDNDVTMTTTEGHLDDGVWIEPERRYNVGKLIKSMQLPKNWRIVQRGTHAAIWIDNVMGTLNIVFECDEFPEVALGAMPPMINVTLQRSDDGRVTMHSYSLFG